MNKLEDGMFIRTDDGKINKFKRYITDKKRVCETDMYARLAVDNIVKASFDIIDVIKPKDIILGRDGKLYQCWKIYKDYVFTYSKNKYGNTITLVDYQIDRILTKEQFESMSYRIGE